MEFTKSQHNYYLSEKELLALELTLQHFDIYVTAAKYPLNIFKDYSYSTNIPTQTKE